MLSKIKFLFMKNMSKTLIVVKPFYMLDAGDILQLSEDGLTYKATYNEQIANTIDDGADIYGDYSSALTISVGYAKELIEQGYLMSEPEQNKTEFVNIFTEIDKLLTKYSNELLTIEKDFADQPACVKVEKITVLNNMIKLLNHLKNLKKQ